MGIADELGKLSSERVGYDGRPAVYAPLLPRILAISWPGGSPGSSRALIVVVSLPLRSCTRTVNCSVSPMATASVSPFLTALTDVVSEA